VTAGIFATISVVALASFAWPFVVPASGDLAETWTMVIVCLLVPVLAVIAVIVAERGVTGRPDAAKFVAMLGLLAAAGVVVRLFGSAAGGIEAVFVNGQRLGAQPQAAGRLLRQRSNASV
jgi:energy-coupling factor transport system substrate-specific component